MAAYNGGAGRVRQAIKKSGSRDFWTLQPYLREETRNHVKKFIGTHYIFEGSGGLATMSAAETKAYLANFSSTQKAELSEAELANTAVTEVSGRYNSLIVCNWLLMDIADFNKLNPGFDKALAEGQRYPLVAP